MAFSSDAHVGTRAESMSEVRELLRGLEAAAKLKSGGSGDETTRPQQPVRRPPTAMLCILDDGCESGEWRRLRADRTVIGRVEGDVIVPHDSMISSRHAEISRQHEQGRYRWYLADLNSTNGVFLRVGGAILKPGQQFLIGGRVYRFDMPAEESPQEEEKPAGTRGWQSVAPTNLFPTLVEVEYKGDGRRFTLEKNEIWIGRDPGACSLHVPDDPFMSPRHARVYRDTQGRWHVENARSRNGTWVRIEKFPLDADCQFQLGEQRFLFKLK
jgi:pSer/pThr/pTyr-binding forkhead associated (FHA) protein